MQDIQLYLTKKPSTVNKNLLRLVSNHLKSLVIQHKLRFQFIIADNNNKTLLERKNIEDFPTLIINSKRYIGLSEIQTAITTIAQKQVKQATTTEMFHDYIQESLADGDEDEDEDRINSENLQKQVTAAMMGRNNQPKNKQSKGQPANHTQNHMQNNMQNNVDQLANKLKQSTRRENNVGANNITKAPAPAKPPNRQPVFDEAKEDAMFDNLLNNMKPTFES